MKPVINVKKFGNTATIYLDDIVTANAVSISSFDDEPEGAFPQTVAIAKLYEDFGDKYDFNFVERPQKELPTSRKVQATAEILEQVRRTGVLPSAPQTQSAPVLSNPTDGNDASRIVRAMELMVVKLSVAEGKKLKELAAEYAAVKKFIVRLYPALSESIEKVEAENDV